MRSNGPGPSNGDELDPTTIPDFARAWESGPNVTSNVRRPSTPPEPGSYHLVIDPLAIFELDEKQPDGSTETILVVPFGCELCRSQKQACSRARPFCARCKKAGQCHIIADGYQRLPGPKIVKGKARAIGTPEDSEATTQGPRIRRPRVKRVVSASKRPLSPGSGSDSAPAPSRKKPRARTRSRKRKTCTFRIESSDETDTECLEISRVDTLMAQDVGPSVKRGSLEWIFVNNPHIPDENLSGGQKSISPDSLVPRVWTDSLEALLIVFPELAKAKVGLSWFQFETPVLLLDSNCTLGRWINSTTLCIDLLWDFLCQDFELEPTDDTNNQVSVEPHTMVHSSENTLDREADTMDPPLPYGPPSSSPRATKPTSALTSNSRSFPSNDILQQERCPIRHAGETGSIADLDDTMLMDSPTLRYPTDPLCPAEDVPLSPISDGSAIPQAGLRLPIPRDKPPEVETLLNSKVHFIPLLVWMSHDSGLVPCNLSPEYVYVCMGLFFVSELSHKVLCCEGSSDDKIVRGQVRWRVTLQWAPGGEDALFDNDTSSPDSVEPRRSSKALERPWWSRSDDVDILLPRPRELRSQIFSYIPLDFLAEFYPSESFPRGWLCKSCGMINLQEFFRHQICESVVCGSALMKRIPEGKADALSSLRDPYQSGSLIRPTNNIPQVVVSDRAIWDNGMQTWNYAVREGVMLCHVFTGNQTQVQEDATTLLERIQREAVLRKEDQSSPYYVHTTTLVHPSDGSEATVPTGTPDCVRIAYYTLCDFVHRYAEMDVPRFGEVRMQAWVSSGSKKGGVLRTRKSPAVIHCLGSEVVLKFVPKGGYRDVAISSTRDKGKGRAVDEDTEPSAGPSCNLEQDRDNQPSSFSPIPRPEVTAVDEGMGKTTHATDTAQQRLEGSGVATVNDSQRDLGTEVEPHKDGRSKRARVHKKNKDKSKVRVPEISMTLVHGDGVVLFGDDFECQIIRFGTSILVIGFPEAT